MSIIESAWATLYPNEPLKYHCELAYSGRFKGFNANVRKYRDTLTFNLSRKWRPVSNDIKVGLIQELFVKILNKKGHTINMDLYNYFLKSVDKTIEVTKSDPILESFFHKINAQFFYGMMDQPNLAWGQDSTSSLGHYSFGTDCITISRIFHPDTCDDLELLEFVLYHEMLHKHHKFESYAGRTRAHTPAFRKDEDQFPNKRAVEQRMNKYASKMRRGGGWF